MEIADDGRPASRLQSLVDQGLSRSSLVHRFR
jgi:hypothetical protein